MTLSEAERRLVHRCPNCGHAASVHGAEDGCGGLRPPDDCGCMRSFGDVVYGSVEAVLAARLVDLTARAEAAEAKVTAVEALAEEWDGYGRGVSSTWRHAATDLRDLLVSGHAMTETLPHVHVVDYEDTTDPDHHGRILVTGVCACGHVMYVHHDSVL